MGDLERVQKKFTLILAVLGVVALVFMVYLLWPGSSPSAKLAQEQRLQQQVNSLTSEVAPLGGLEQKLGKTRVDVKNFYAQKVPSEYSEISQHLEKLVRETGVTDDGIHYSQDKTDRTAKDDLPDVERISVDTTIKGEYTKVARFINALEQDKFVFIVNQITLNGSEGGNLVSLQLKFDTFLKQPS
ncbi:MAG: hypothetical protein WA738_06495 [Candidatus Angelobacter sp.]